MGGKRGSGFKADLVYRVTGHMNWGAEVTCPKVTEQAGLVCMKSFVSKSSVYLSNLSSCAFSFRTNWSCLESSWYTASMGTDGVGMAIPLNVCICI